VLLHIKTLTVVKDERKDGHDEGLIRATLVQEKRMREAGCFDYGQISGRW
jgi:hypothetical protein